MECLELQRERERDLAKSGRNVSASAAIEDRTACWIASFSDSSLVEYR